jgi:hypothetical protein
MLGRTHDMIDYRLIFWAEPLSNEEGVYMWEVIR